MNFKRIIFTLLLIIWMIIIFIFSHQNGVESTRTSNRVIMKLVEITISVTNIESSEIEKLIENYSFIIRKMAHVTIYFILGILIYVTLKSYDVKNIFVYSLIFCLLYAISDECHQLFMDGRSGQITDVMIDFLGSTISCIFIKLKIS